MKRKLSVAGKRVVWVSVAWLLSMFAAPVFAEPEEWPAAKDYAACPPQIEEAIGYATCYNPWRAVALAAPVSQDPAIAPNVRARAWWTQALAWGTFCVEYRTPKYLDDYRAARAKALALNPDLIWDRLLTLDAKITYWIEKPGKPLEVLAEFEKRLAANPNDWVALCQAGLAGAWAATDEGLSKPSAQARARTGLDRMAKFVGKYPNLFEPAALYVTILADPKLRPKNIVEIARAIAARCGGRSYYFDQQGPDILAMNIQSFVENGWAAVNLDAMAKNRQPVLERESSLTSTKAFLVTADKPSGESVKEKLAICQDFVDRLESGRLPSPRGYDLLIAAKAYYRLGGALMEANRPDDALATYGKLSAISPHYAEVHYNNAVIKSALAGETPNPDRRRELLESARRELELQWQYAWHGRTKDAQSLLKEIDAKIAALSAGKPLARHQ